MKDRYPNVYKRAVELMSTRKEFEKGITAIAILDNMQVPEWIKDYIDYTTIVNDNLRNFPVESVGLRRFDNDSVNFSNIINL